MNVHLNYIRAWFKALDEENRENNRQIPKNNQELAALVKEYNDRLVDMHGEKAVLTQMDESDRIEAKLVVAYELKNDVLCCVSILRVT